MSRNGAVSTRAEVTTPMLNSSGYRLASALSAPSGHYACFVALWEQAEPSHRSAAGTWIPLVPWAGIWSARWKRWKRWKQRKRVASVIVGVVLLIYLFVTNGTTNLSTIVLSDIDIWLALAAFTIALSCGVGLVRRGHALRRAGG